jgi:hypothetical protein
VYGIESTQHEGRHYVVCSQATAARKMQEMHQNKRPLLWHEQTHLDLPIKIWFDVEHVSEFEIDTETRERMDVQYWVMRTGVEHLCRWTNDLLGGEGDFFIESCHRWLGEPSATATVKFKFSFHIVCNNTHAAVKDSRELERLLGPNGPLKALIELKAATYRAEQRTKKRKRDEGTKTLEGEAWILLTGALDHGVYSDFHSKRVLYSTKRGELQHPLIPVEVSTASVGFDRNSVQRSLVQLGKGSVPSPLIFTHLFSRDHEEWKRSLIAPSPVECGYKKCVSEGDIKSILDGLRAAYPGTKAEVRSKPQSHAKSFVEVALDASAGIVCPRIGRAHKSNRGVLVFNVSTGKCRRSCMDSECVAKLNVGESKYDWEPFPFPWVHPS